MGEQTPQTAIEVLKGARALISDPAKWTQGVEGYFSGDCFCIRGATWEVSGVPRGHCPSPALAEAEGELLQTVRHVTPTFRIVKRRGVGMLADWNDRARRSHAEVLNLFDRTIARLESEASDAL